jgi:AcrR family transcriptional regulator
VPQDQGQVGKGDMSDARTRFLRAGERLFRRQGYEATGLKELISDAAAPSGSLYYYFPGGKEHLGAEVLSYASTLYGDGIRSTFERFADPVEATRKMFANEVRVLEGSDYQDGCPIASVTSDIASTNESLRAACTAAFDIWIGIIAEGYVRAGVEEADATTLASFILSSLEGAIILSRAAKSPTALQSTSALVVAAVEVWLSALDHETAQL